MVPNCIQRYIPALDGVAALTVGAELAAVNIRMAVGALRAYILKDEAGVALGAGYLLMHAAQWISRFVVIEFRVRPDGLPTGVSMAILAGNRDWSMGIGDFRQRGAGGSFLAGRWMRRRNAA